MATPATGEKIILNFGWEGPSSWHGGWSHGGLDVGVVDLVFKNAKTEISVHIPDNISLSTVKKLPFTCRRYHETECELNGRKFKPLTQKTYPDSLNVTVEQIHNLTIKAGIFEKSPHKGPAIMDSSSGKITREERVLRSDREIKLEVPKELEMGQTYSLVVTSSDLSLSARLLKEERANGAMKDERKASKDELKERMKKMGKALVTEGMQNLDLASRGGIGTFDSSSTTADVFAHGMKGIIRSGQQIHPEIRVPHTKPSESSSDLDILTKDELQSRFEETFKKDKEFESQRMRAAIAGNIEEMNRVIEVEHANSQLLIKLAEALERKGIKAQIPQSESFQSAANQSAEAHVEALKDLEDLCKVQ
jgi:hypothetical protein